MSSAEEQRKLLEKLMGKEALVSTPRRREPELESHRVCKSFLVGTCPHDLFVGTKQDLGKCPNLHLEKHKLEYEYRTRKKGEKFPEFEHEYLKHLQKYISELDRNMEAAQRRLERTPEEKDKIAAITKELDELDTNMGLTSEEINCLVDAGEISKAAAVAANLELMAASRKELAETARTTIENIGQSSQQKLQVCEGCGAYLSRLDSDRRLADHFIGKIHLGYVKMRGEYNRMVSLH